MAVTIVAILMIMAGYILILYSAVALIQEKRFYTSAPAEVQAVIPEREDRTELFWFNGREHILHFLLYIPASIVLVLLCTGIGMLL